ncbi:unnamed protein product [Effrenium voratum]|nr:unnamed protein product [Effrenium voratum]
MGEVSQTSSCAAVSGGLSSPLLEKKVEGHVSAPALTLNLINASLGSGALSLPWAAAGASLMAAAGVMFLVLALNLGTNLILVVAAERLQIFDLGGLLGKLPGFWARPLRLFFDVSIWCSVGLTLVGYLVVVSDALAPLGLAKDAGLLLGACAVLPLCLMDPKYLAFSSGLSVLANVYLVALIAFLFLARPQGTNANAAGFCMLGYGPGLITMCSALMQSMIFQMCTLPLYETLQARSVRRFGGCLLASFSFVFVLFFALCCMSLSLYGEDAVASNLLQDLPEDAWGNFARLGLGLSVLAVYPIYLESMVAPLKHAEARAQRLHHPLQLPSPASSDFESDDVVGTLSARSLARAKAQVLGLWLQLPLPASRLAVPAVVLASALGGSIAPHLGTCNIMNGASQVAAMVGWAPGCAGLFLVGDTGPLWRCLMAALILFATLMSVVGMMYTDNFVPEMHCISG